MKTKLIFSLMILFAGFSYESNAQKSFYDFTVESIDGSSFDFSQLKGKKVLVVNTASKCGFTPQYEGLEKLYEEFSDDNFVILGFPANNFMKQEPGTNEEIADFCEKNYGVTFPMMAKISVKGDDMHELYRWLTTKTENGVLDSEVSWNFQKFLIDEKGNLVATYPPKTKPDDAEIVGWITASR